MENPAKENSFAENLREKYGGKTQFKGLLCCGGGFLSLEFSEINKCKNVIN